MCSKTFGPARAPPFVTWPTNKIGIFSPLAISINRLALDLIWLILPGVERNSEQ